MPTFDIDDPESLDRRLRDILTDRTSDSAMNDLQRAIDLVEQARDGEAQPDDWKKDPLVHLAGTMDSITSDLRQGNTGQDVQTEGQDIVNKLDELIALAEQMSQACNGGGQGMGMANGGGPAGESTLAPGPGGMGELIDPREGASDWTDLPDKERQRILQSSTEGFPPGFEDLLGEYYNRLATEEAAGPNESDDDD
jgi:hypothetical protein